MMSIWCCLIMFIKVETGGARQSMLLFNVSQSRRITPELEIQSFFDTSWSTQPLQRSAAECALVLYLCPISRIGRSNRDKTKRSKVTLQQEKKHTSHSMRPNRELALWLRQFHINCLFFALNEVCAPAAALVEETCSSTSQPGRQQV